MTIMRCKSVCIDAVGPLWRNGQVKIAVAIALLACLGLFGTSANAACKPGSSAAGGLRAAQFLHAPALTQQLKSFGDEDGNDDDANESIVGLWRVSFISDLFPDEGFDQFHSDGTEILNDTAPPQPANGAGTICLGVFKKIGPRTYKLKHPFWIFDASGKFAGSGVFLEEIVVHKGGKTYGGSFTVITYDANGSQNFEATGELKAERITAD